MSDLSETLPTNVTECRSSLLAGQLAVPINLGLMSRLGHIERGERDCLVSASPVLASHVGPAARVIECGPFAGQIMAIVLNALERPKAGVVMTTTLGPRQIERLRETISTAEITHIDHNATYANWPLEPIGAGKTLVCIGGGGYGLLPPSQAHAALDNASQSLQQGDFVALTLEMNRDSAMIEATYRDYGNQIIMQALTSLGRVEGLEARIFYDAVTQRVVFGAMAQKGASIAWNGTRVDFDAGTWLDLGAMTLHTPTKLLDLHPDFEVYDQWHSQDKVVTLLFLRKR